MQKFEDFIQYIEYQFQLNSINFDESVIEKHFCFYTKNPYKVIFDYHALSNDKLTIFIKSFALNNGLDRKWRAVLISNNKRKKIFVPMLPRVWYDFVYFLYTMNLQINNSSYLVNNEHVVSFHGYFKNLEEKKFFHEIFIQEKHVNIFFERIKGLEYKHNNFILKPGSKYDLYLSPDNKGYDRYGRSINRLWIAPTKNIENSEIKNNLRKHLADIVMKPLDKSIITEVNFSTGFNSLVLKLRENYS